MTFIDLALTTKRMPPNINTRLLVLAAIFMASIATSGTAEAQYKNTSFAFDMGGWVISRPPAVGSGDQQLAASDRPFRYRTGFRLGFDGAFKMMSDHFWLVPFAAINVYAYGSPSGNASEQAYDKLASKVQGTLLGLQAGAAVRWMILTDRYRPYIQLGVSYQRIFSSPSESKCTNTALCDAPNGSTDFMPHVNIPALHITPGFEWFVKRDIALRIFADVQWWLMVNAQDNVATSLGMAIGFFS